MTLIFYGNDNNSGGGGGGSSWLNNACILDENFMYLCSWSDLTITQVSENSWKGIGANNIELDINVDYDSSGALEVLHIFDTFSGTLYYLSIDGEYMKNFLP